LSVNNETKTTKSKASKEMPKTFLEMSRVDVKKYIKKRDGANYLPWVACKKLLHELGAENVYFEPLSTQSGSSLFMTEIPFTDKNGVINRCYEVRVKIVIDDLTFNYCMPVMNGANPVKDNSMSQQRVNNAQARAFVKGVAMRTGLGFSLWLDDDGEEDDEENLSKHNILKIRERFEQLISSKMSLGLTIKDICTKINVDEEQFAMYLKYFGLLDKLEKALQKV